MEIYLLDGSLSLNIFFDKADCTYEDNICLSFYESCPDEERIFLAGETNIYLTREQARQFAEALLAAVEESCEGDATSQKPRSEKPKA